MSDQQPTAESRAERETINLDAKNSVEIPLSGEQNGSQAQIGAGGAPKRCTMLELQNVKNWRGLFKLLQVLVGILILALIRPGSRCGQSKESEGLAEYLLILVTYLATFATVLLLIDSLLIDQPLRKAFGQQLWFRLELWFTGLVALLVHLLAFLVLALNVNCYSPFRLNVLSACFGLIASLTYLADWVRVFGNRKQQAGGKKSDSFEHIEVH